MTSPLEPRYETLHPAQDAPSPKDLARLRAFGTECGRLITSLVPDYHHPDGGTISWRFDSTEFTNAIGVLVTNPGAANETSEYVSVDGVYTGQTSDRISVTRHTTGVE